ncbi:ATP-binding protein [Anaeromyxobacter diazotrophicus]|uniref:histidine kinase n=1 Tax=Anaeromyxobacter diazotrophicus TaxID=2590199 RepID=A0A7I9VH46_9BACT|nr:ATP-binding protein [Anaeromyxobacter diazotrophicus]GEJ55665.1 PAS domain-containing sensor histidine kinase [Anaeromyxobacter diazotrophicus]
MAAPVELPGAAPAAGRDPLFRKLVWLTLFRLVTVTVLLGGTVAAAWTTPGFIGEVAGSLFRLVLFTYVASLGLALGLRWRAALHALAYGQVALDVVIAAAVVRLTGFSESVFVFMFLFGIVNGSILLFRRGAVVAAALSISIYLPLVTVGPAVRPSAPTVFVHLFAFAATAALASYLAEQLRRTGERLEAREVDLAAITALHESIVQSVASGLVTIDVEGRITFLNRAGEQITGVEAAAVRGTPAARWFGGFQPGVERGESELVNARGERLWLGYTAFPLLARGGEQIGRAVIFQDLTALRQLQDEMQRSERLADLGRVAAGLAHELRNPLASMAGSVELLRASSGLTSGDARLMDIVLREAARLEQLVAAFLAFSRPSPPRREPVDLAHAVAETLEVFAHDPAAGRVRLERELEPATASCDAGQLRQVLWNLLANAAHAAGQREGGGTVRVRCAAEGERARLEVEDDGPGISAADLPHLFTPFFTTREGGTGLGLATVQRIVDAHGGAVGVDSVPGQGTRFTVRLPAAARPAAG